MFVFEILVDIITELPVKPMLVGLVLLGAGVGVYFLMT